MIDDDYVYVPYSKRPVVTSEQLNPHKWTDWRDVQNPITDEEVKAWLVALRGGDYAQTQEVLCDGSGFCCLGVLADVNNMWSDELKKDHTLLNIANREGTYTTYYSQKLPGEMQNILAEMNDNGMSFTEIADILEALFVTHVVDVVKGSAFEFQIEDKLNVRFNTYD